MDLDITTFTKDINNTKILKNLIKNKELLISKNIYSTPTFIVNGKILDNKYAIDYFEDVIIEELKLK
ncbi:MAG: thioredoxin domain-containing protein [Bacteroidales bacterium]|nr:thioredoxin domain-containing protein [Bacteroidales bacterium]